MKKHIECDQGFLISIRIFNTKNIYDMKKGGDMKMEEIPEEIVKLAKSGEVKLKTTKPQEVSECQFSVRKIE